MSDDAVDYTATTVAPATRTVSRSDLCTSSRRVIRCPPLRLPARASGMCILAHDLSVLHAGFGCAPSSPEWTSIGVCGRRTQPQNLQTWRSTIMIGRALAQAYLAQPYSVTLVPLGFHCPFVGLSVSHKTETGDLNSFYEGRHYGAGGAVGHG
jgi:hypothetical protein